jgi:hypothetical protein
MTWPVALSVALASKPPRRTPSANVIVALIPMVAWTPLCTDRLTASRSACVSGGPTCRVERHAHTMTAMTHITIKINTPVMFSPYVIDASAPVHPRTLCPRVSGSGCWNRLHACGPSLHCRVEDRSHPISVVNGGVLTTLARLDCPVMPGSSRVSAANEDPAVCRIAPHTRPVT